MDMTKLQSAELDALVPEEVMGWKRCEPYEPVVGGTSPAWEPAGGWDSGDDDRPGGRYVYPTWSPSLYITAAWEVLTVVRTWMFSRRYRFIQELQRTIARRLKMTEGTVPAAEAIVLLMEPVDICRAAMVAVEIGETDARTD